MAYIVPVLLTTVTLYTIGLGLYRLTLHPLSKFPGPKLSAFTGWYEVYVDFFGGPRNTFAYEIQHMHDRYGPIVRINPHELHVSDHGFFDTLYAGGGSKRDKYPPSANVQGAPDAVFGTVGHDAHRKRRGAISSFFSKKSVTTNEPLINEKVDLLCDVFESAMHKGEVINIRVPLLAYATDFYCAHALGDSGDMNLLKDMGRAQVWRDNIVGLLHLTPIVRQFSWIVPFVVELPMWLIRLVSSDMALVIRVLWDMREQAKAAIREFEKASDIKVDQANLMESILRSNLPSREKTRNRMAQEGFSVLVASGDTIARTLTTAVYHLLANPHVLGRLREELVTVLPGPNDEVELRQLESLSLLTAVIKESLRISALITSRAVLQAPGECLTYRDWVIPANTPVGMTLSDLMMDPNIFPEPDKFDPGRWLESSPLYVRNAKYFVPFHRGHRSCIAISLAWAEMYIALAMLLRRVDLELYDVVRERDIDHHRDCFLGEPRDDTKGVRVKVLGMLQ
ncbi:hypothetical protein SLS64_013500 [Diaporthe eres]|uniref:Trichodiene oxygenase n=1 Tax=Diaporthe eres TaxID=83184 RepID=A0ABR1NQS2_DIAER